MLTSIMRFTHDSISNKNVFGIKLGVHLGSFLD